MRFPIRKSPCTRRGGDGVGRLSASQRNAHSKVAVVSPMASSWSRHSASWSSSAQAEHVRCRRGGWPPAPRRTGAAVVPGPGRRRASAGSGGRSSRRRSRRRSETDCQVRQWNRRRPRCGGPVRRRRPRRVARAASSSMPACTSSGGPVRRISDRRCPPVTASNAHVVRLAPPVSACRFSTTAAPRAGSSTRGEFRRQLLRRRVTCGRT